jgi:drug/metabolite transporter (DMT)-like permease
MKLSIYSLAFGMLSLGTINVVVIKYQDMVAVGQKRDGTPITFKHPVFQSLLMFGGESLCLMAYFLLRLRKRIRRQQGLEPKSLGRKQGSLFFLKRSLIFIIPSLLDAVGATVLNLALYYTYASVYQMLRGTLVLFAALFTTVILQRRLFVHHWLGVLLISAGAAIVGAASVIRLPFGSSPPSSFPSPHSHTPPSQSSSILDQGLSSFSGFLRVLHGEGDSAPSPLLGDILVIVAQSLSAFQFIVEEKLLSSWRVQPLLAVGLEGAWGIVICTLSLPFLPLIKDSEGKPIDDLLQATGEVLANQSLLYSAIISVLCIGAFNFCGLSVTKALSGANRAAIDACRTLFVWLVALFLGWETFKVREQGKSYADPP